MDEIHFAPPEKRVETIVCWHLQGNRIIPGLLTGGARLADFATIHSTILALYRFFLLSPVESKMSPCLRTAQANPTFEGAKVSISLRLHGLAQVPPPLREASRFIVSLSLSLYFFGSARFLEVTSFFGCYPRETERNTINHHGVGRERGFLLEEKTQPSVLLQGTRWDWLAQCHLAHWPLEGLVSSVRECLVPAARVEKRRGNPPQRMVLGPHDCPRGSNHHQNKMGFGVHTTTMIYPRIVIT